jgi:predicted nucleic acid-binding protein
MPSLKYLADANVICGWMCGEAPVAEWTEDHRIGIAMSSLTLFELRRGIKSKQEGKFPQSAERDFHPEGPEEHEGKGREETLRDLS